MAFWATVVVVVVLVAYPLSFGPACWITGWCDIQGNWLFIAYAPLIWTMNAGPDFLIDALTWYSLLGAPEQWGWDVDPTGTIFVGFSRAPEILVPLSPAAP